MSSGARLGGKGGLARLARAFLLCRAGTTAIEYGLIGLLVGVAGIAGFSALGGSLRRIFDNIGAVFANF